MKKAQPQGQGLAKQTERIGLREKENLCADSNDLRIMDFVARFPVCIGDAVLKAQNNFYYSAVGYEQNIFMADLFFERIPCASNAAEKLCRAFALRIFLRPIQRVPQIFPGTFVLLPFCACRPANRY